MSSLPSRPVTTHSCCAANVAQTHRAFSCGYPKVFLSDQILCQAECTRYLEYFSFMEWCSHTKISIIFNVNIVLGANIVWAYRACHSCQTVECKNEDDRGDVKSQNCRLRVLKYRENGHFRLKACTEFHTQAKTAEVTTHTGVNTHTDHGNCVNQWSPWG